jgi:RimJ/RimL family protein N-acetyltransferase
MIAPDTTLRGTLVRLRPLERADAVLFERWYADTDLLYWLHISEGPDLTQESWLKAHEAGVEDPSAIAWMIETQQELPIGHLGLIRIDPAHFRATLYIAIGEKSCWGGGYGADAIRLVLRYGFQRLNLRRLELITDIDNARGIRCYENCGFVREGVLRQHRLRRGKALDMLQMAVLRDEWEGQK